MISSLLAILLVNHTLITFIISIFGGIFIFPYIPKPSYNTPERSAERRLYFRKVYRNRFLLISTVNLILLYLMYYKGYDLRIYSTSLSMAMVCIGIIMSNTFEKFLGYCEKIIGNFKKDK